MCIEFSEFKDDCLLNLELSDLLDDNEDLLYYVFYPVLGLT